MRATIFHGNHAARYLAMPGCFILAMMLGCDRIFYYPDRRIRGSPAEQSLAFEDVFFKTEDGVTLHGWFFPAKGAAKATVLHVHGNAANITAHYEFISWLPAEGYNVLTFDYRGYGRSSGHVTRTGTVIDASAALNYLRGRKGVESRRIVVFGQSIGGAVATVLASQRHGQVAALAIDSSFTAYREIARHHVAHSPLLFLLAWWFPATIGEGLDAVGHIGEIGPTPVLIMHGKQDRIVPWEMARKLYDAAKSPKEIWLTEDTDHMEVWFVHPKEARERLLRFFADSFK